MNQADITKPQFQKMIFLLNALEHGWTVRKKGDSYVFTKKHENRKEVLNENYLEQFVLENMNSDKLGVSTA